MNINNLNNIINKEELIDLNAMINQFLTKNIFIKIDHISLSTKTLNNLKTLEKELLARGANSLHTIKKWTGSKTDKTSREYHKHIFTVTLDNLSIVGVSPASDNDQIDKYMHNKKNTVIHHIAFLVQNLDKAILNFDKYFNYKLLTTERDNQEQIQQVFLKNTNDLPLIELVYRKNKTIFQLTNQNITNLSASLS